MSHRLAIRPTHRAGVAVIGAGVSGLAAAKCLLDEGIQPVVFEQAAEIGGVWNFHEEEPDGGGPAYRSLRTNTSKQTTAFSDFPFPYPVPEFPVRAQVLDYLNHYADRFGLRSAIRLRTRVEAASPRDHAAGWQITYRRDDSGEAISEPFDAVLVCSGLYTSPATPHYPGTETYQGEIVHSRSYKGPEGFEGKRVVVVGAGSSGVDIAVELSKVARSTALSAARRAWFIPRYIGGKPYDHRLTRLATHVPYRARMRVFQSMLFSEYKRMGIGDPAKALGAALPSEPLDVLTGRLTPGSEIVQLIASGAIAHKPGIAGLEGEQVVFTDGSRSPADVIVLATGYNMGFPFLQGALAGAPGNTLDLYKHLFHPELPGLAFIGLCIVAGSVFPVIELQARWAARALAGRVALPSPEQMREEIRARRSRMEALGIHPMRVQLLEYMDELAAEIGARPNLACHPALAWQLLTGAPAAAQYRLQGPLPWKSAGRAIRDANRRRPTRPLRTAS